MSKKVTATISMAVAILLRVLTLTQSRSRHVPLTSVHGEARKRKAPNPWRQTYASIRAATIVPIAAARSPR